MISEDILKNWKKKKPVITCGDFNVAFKEIDLKILRPTGKMQASPMRKGLRWESFRKPVS